MNHWLLGLLYVAACLVLGAMGGGLALWLRAVKRARQAPGHIHSEIKRPAPILLTGGRWADASDPIKDLNEWRKIIQAQPPALKDVFVIVSGELAESIAKIFQDKTGDLIPWRRYWLDTLGLEVFQRMERVPDTDEIIFYGLGRPSIERQLAGPT